MKLIERAQYLNRMLELRGTPDIKIITGVRRSGKSKLLEAFISQIRQDEDVNVIFVDLVDLQNEPLKDFRC